MILIQAAVGASRSRGTLLAAQCRRPAAQRGRNRAIVAVAHSQIVIISHIIANREPDCKSGRITSTSRIRKVKPDG